MSAELAGRMNQRIVIERPSTVRTETGLQTGGWEQVVRCLAAIEPEGTGAETEAMALSAMPRFRVTMRSRDGIAVGQRICWRSRVLAVRQRIDDPRLPDRILLRCEEDRKGDCTRSGSRHGRGGPPRRCSTNARHGLLRCSVTRLSSEAGTKCAFAHRA